MSTSDEQPLTRRQIRERERAREAGRAVAEGTAGGAPAEGASPPSAARPVAGSTPAATSPVPASAPQAADVSVPVAAPVPASAPTPPPASVAGPDGLTRRQMRAQRIEQTGPSAPVPLQAPGPEPRRRLVDALSTVDEIVAPLDESAPASARQSVGDDSSVVPGAGADSAAAVDHDDDGRAPGPRRTGQPTSGPSAPAAAPTSAPSVFPLDLSGSRPGSASTPVDGDSAASSPAVAPGSAEASAAVAEPAPASVPEPSGFVPPVGHWTTQSDEPDDDTAPGRALGTHTGQTNALILTDQQVADVTGALNATGEIIITGSIDLPRSLGATGSQARIDNSDIDRLLEQGDAESAETDAAPVRASRAISTHTSTRSVVLAASQPASSKLPLILGIGGGVLGAGIIGVVIAGFATGILGG